MVRVVIGKLQMNRSSGLIIYDKAWWHSLFFDNNKPFIGMVSMNIFFFKNTLKGFISMSCNDGNIQRNKWTYLYGSKALIF